MMIVYQCGIYTCIKSPVDWHLIDALAIITVIWIIATFIYKGIKQYKVFNYPQMYAMIPYPEWDNKLLGKSNVGAGRLIAGFFKTLFVDALTMAVLGCEFGESYAEIVRTKTVKRAAKLLIVWGFIFAGLSTIIAYITFPYNYIILNITNPARILGMLGGLFIIIGAAIWLSVRYKEVNYKGVFDFIGADYLPVMVLLIGISGFILQGAILAYATYGTTLPVEAFLWTAIHFHAITVAAFFWLFFWTNADHIIYMFFWRTYYHAYEGLPNITTKLPQETLHPLNRTGKEIQGGYKYKK
nr:MAG: hypothetical protein TU35_09185 [Thermoproteus sp. AZ2]